MNLTLPMTAVQASELKIVAVYDTTIQPSVHDTDVVATLTHLMARNFL